jgi:hypothetical protein
MNEWYKNINLILIFSSHFVEMCVGLVNLFDNSLEDEINYKYLMMEVPIFGLSCLQIAVIGRRKKFVATALVQNLLTSVWNGKVSNKTDLKARFKVKRFFLIDPTCLIQHV